MSGMTTFGNNDSISSHGEESIDMLNRIAEITKEAYKYLPEKDCTIECGVFVDVDSRAFLHAIQHIRESIEAYRDLAEELDEDIRDEREEHAYAIERFRKYGTQSKDAEKLFEQLQEECEHFRALAISRNKELEELQARYDELKKECDNRRANKLERELKDTVLNRDANLKLYTAERERSTQLEQRCSELVIDRDKAVEYWTKYCEGLQQKYREALAAKDREIYEVKLERDKNSDSVTYWKCKCHKLEKTQVNNPSNFCGNCRHYAQMGKDDGDFEGICTQHYVKRVDPDDASCEHFKSTYDKTDKPDHEVCDNCDGNCDTCGYYPF